MTGSDRRQQKNRAEVHYWSVECWQKWAEKEMLILCLHQIHIIIIIIINNIRWSKK